MLRGQIIGAELGVPSPGSEQLYYPTPQIITTPSQPAPSPVSAPTTTVPSIPDTGDIQIIGLPAPILPISADIPMYLYVDSNNVGRIYELPKTITNVSVGTHIVYARAGDITTPPKTVVVTKDQTSTVRL